MYCSALKAATQHTLSRTTFLAKEVISVISNHWIVFVFIARKEQNNVIHMFYAQYKLLMYIDVKTYLYTLMWLVDKSENELLSFRLVVPTANAEFFERWYIRRLRAADWNDQSHINTLVTGFINGNEPYGLSTDTNIHPV